MDYRVHKQGQYLDTTAGRTRWVREPERADRMDRSQADTLAARLGADAEPADHDNRAALL